MSITTGDFRSKVTSSTLLDKKQKHEPITCLTAYDYISARLLDEAGIEGELAVAEMRSGRAEVVQMWGRPESAREEFRRLRSQ